MLGTNNAFIIISANANVCKPAFKTAPSTPPPLTPTCQPQACTLHLLTALTIAKTKRTISLSVSMGKLFDMRWYISLSTNTAVSTCTGARTPRRNRGLNCDVSGMFASGLTPQNEPVSVSLRPWL